MQPFTSSAELKPLRPSLVSSSPPPLSSNNERLEQRLRMAAAPTPSRQQLAEMMGVAYSDKARKIYLRAKVKQWVLRHIDMSKPFTEYSNTTMTAIVKGCTKHMNGNYLAGNPWERETTRHVIHSIFEDTRRNAGSREKCAAKRKEKRELAVSLEASISTKCLFPTNMRLDEAWI